MPSRSRFEVAVRRPERRSPGTVTVLVFVGLGVATLVNAWIEAPADHDLPGVALASQTLLVVERTLAFFAAWLLVLVVAAQALSGRLPVEISGRGVRYADGDQTQESLGSALSALSNLDVEMKALRYEVASLTTKGSDH